ncbi:MULTISPECIES: CaiB/BaiF CoA transferase family protein [Acidiphilium]|uniref:Formyl-CoA transferase n=1 Tax=Acidiphilium rubrum TaxID=526 RepID=A0A8G2FD69_ACIRU|nr:MULTISPECIES: CoA transferase [Acidiphilium]SIQ70854.1 formyl-CoA transferase [Acidiphilium rubrum]
MSTRALDGLKIIDLTRVLGGPYCTMILADHGADVIKIEPPQGDEVRDWGPPFLTRDNGTRDASYYLGANRNKRAMSLDLAHPAGRAVLLRLLETADALVENFKPGSLEKWGIGYDTLSARFPRLIHCRISGFGADGPLGGLPGYDAVVQAMTGLMTINGDPAHGPVRMGTPIVDLGTGLYAALGIMMAIHERRTSGRGQFIDMTLHDTALALLHPAGANYLLAGKRPAATGNAHPNIAPYETFPTATCDIFIAGGNDGQFRKLCAILARPDIAANPAFATNSDRLANRPALKAALTAALAGHDGAALAITLIEAGVPAGAVQPVDVALNSAHAHHRAMIAELDGIKTLGTPIKFSRTPGGPRTAPPAFAQHQSEILTEHGFTAADITALEQDQIIRPRRR